MTHDTSITPWYRQFWPWFLIALPATSVIAGIATVVIANQSPDGVVVDDYYKQGLAINQDLERDRRAAELELRARVSMQPTGTLHIAMSGDDIERLAALQVRLLHPTKAGRDQTVLAQRGPDGSFTARLDHPEAAHWHVAIEPPGNAWRLQGRLQWPQTSQITLRASS